MRYIKHFLENTAGIEIYPMISLLIFFFFFLFLGLYVFMMRKAHVKYMASNPLDLDLSQESKSVVSKDPQS